MIKNHKNTSQPQGNIYPHTHHPTKITQHPETPTHPTQHPRDLPSKIEHMNIEHMNIQALAVSGHFASKHSQLERGRPP